MIELESLTIRNFLSYGDYDTIIDLSDRGQCFIHGHIADGPDDDADRSNGSGKSSLTQSILWCLSGKTMHDKNPGDGVRCWFNDENTVVTLKFKGGAELIRARTAQSDTELIYNKGDKELIRSALSTTPNQQSELNRLLRFDFDVFCGSVFSSQYKKKWMEMSDQYRKQVLERVMGVDRLSVYADVAKKKRDRAVVEQDILKTDIERIDGFITSLDEQMQTNKDAIDDFARRQSTKHVRKIEEVREAQEELDEFEPINIKSLESKWAVVEQIETMINKMTGRIDEIGTQINDKDTQTNNAIASHNNLIKATQDEESKFLKELSKETQSALDAANSGRDALLNEFVNEHKSESKEIFNECDILTTQLATLRGEVNSRLGRIKDWEAKDGEICLECEQDVPHTHTSSKIDIIRAEVDVLNTNIIIAENDLDNTQDRLQKAEESFKTTSENLDRTSVQEKDKIKEKEEETAKEAQENCEGAVGVANDRIRAARRDRDNGVRDLEEERTNLKSQVSSTGDKLSDRKPDQTIREGESHNAQAATLSKSVQRLQQEAKNILQEPNPHDDVIKDLQERIADYGKEKATAQRQLEQYDMIYKHLNYVYRAYSDRRKIKSWCISKHRPYFNSRLDHYLDAFDLDLRISITDSLAISSNMWKPAYQSGGERARTDLAFTFAVFDLHNGIHGRQCNMMVLDEPDEGLDEAGVRSLINIVKDELVSRFETILVISHRGALKDVFPSQITVERTDRLSHILDSR